MTIHFFEEQIKKPRLKYRLVSKWIKQIIELHNRKTGNLSYIFCSNSFLLQINNKYLQHDYFTDIITFDYVKENTIEGDVFISCEMVKENSKIFGVNLEDEFLRVVSHGVLHLLGYGDGTESEKLLMREKESECISLYKKIEDGVGGL